MNFIRFVWEHKKFFARLPGAYYLYNFIMNNIYPNGSVVILRHGPAAGSKWYRYKCHEAWMAMGLYEPHVAELIVDILGPGDVFYDVGANAGYFSLIASKAVGREGKVVIFEPVPFNIDVIKKQIKANNLCNCILEPVALSSSAGTASLVVPNRNANAHLTDFVSNHFITNDNDKIIHVETNTLDHYIDKYPSPNLIKMDIEGAEVEALIGASLTLTSCAPTFIISTHNPELHKNVISILLESDYEVIDLPGFEHMVFARPISVAKNATKFTSG